MFHVILQYTLSLIFFQSIAAVCQEFGKKCSRTVERLSHVDVITDIVILMHTLPVSTATCWWRKRRQRRTRLLHEMYRDFNYYNSICNISPEWISEYLLWKVTTRLINHTGRRWVNVKCLFLHLFIGASQYIFQRHVRILIRK